MADLFTALGLFLLTHLLPAIRPLRSAVITRIGRGFYFFLFSAISIAATIWLIMAFMDAPYIEVWPYQPWTRWAVLVSMNISCILIVAGLTSANPFSLSFNTKPFEPARPGIVGLTRHPVIWGLGLWSAVHMLPNGDVASLLMFGLLTLLSVTGPRTLTRRRKSLMSDEVWHDLDTTTARLGLVETLSQIGTAKLAGGLALYLVLLYLHGPVIGVSPLAG